MSKQVRIVRATKDKDHPYKQVLRATFDGSGLSFEARGVLAYILMKPDDWTLHVKDIMREGSIGRDKAYSILKELIEAGYAQRIDERDEHGKFDSTTIVVHERPHTEKPYTDNPDTEKPYPENTEHTNKGIPLKKERILNSDKERGAVAPTPKQHPAVTAYREFHNRFPDAAQIKLIVERDPPIAEWVRALRAWAGCGYNPRNITGLLDWANNPNLIVERRSNGTRNGYMSKGEKQNAAVDEAFRLLEERGLVFDES
jgi:hypothetical protein